MIQYLEEAWKIVGTSLSAHKTRVVISIHPVLLAVHPLDNATPSFLIAAHPEM